MTEVTVSPYLPKDLIENTFEGILLAQWIGYYNKGEKGGIPVVEIEGDTENEDDEDIILLEMSESEVIELADLAEEAGTPIALKIAKMLRNPVESGVFNEHYMKINISDIRYEADIPYDGGSGVRMLDVDDLLHSLITRLPDRIPYAEVTWSRACTFISPEGIEWFDRAGDRDARKAEYLASTQLAPSA